MNKVDVAERLMRVIAQKTALRIKSIVRHAEASGAKQRYSCRYLWCDAQSLAGIRKIADGDFFDANVQNSIIALPSILRHMANFDQGTPVYSEDSVQWALKRSERVEFLWDILNSHYRISAPYKVIFFVQQLLTRITTDCERRAGVRRSQSRI